MNAEQSGSYHGVQLILFKHFGYCWTHVDILSPDNAGTFDESPSSHIIFEKFKMFKIENENSYL